MDNTENGDHLNKFSSGGSALVPNATYDDYMCGHENIGFPVNGNNPQGSMYIMPSEELDRILNEANGDISEIEKKLGLPEGHFGDGSIIRVDINDLEEKGLRVANGYESGANEFWNTKADLNGNLPDIKYVKDAEGNNTRYIDTTQTDSKELSKLNGQYWDEKGMYHPPNQEGYDGKTSAGINEAVINQIQNTPENVSYTELSRFARGHSSDVSVSPIIDGYRTENDNTKENIEKVDVSHSNAPPYFLDDKSNYSDLNKNNLAQKNEDGVESFLVSSKRDLQGIPENQGLDFNGKGFAKDAAKDNSSSNINAKSSVDKESAFWGM